MQKEITTDGIIEALGNIISSGDTGATKEIMKKLKQSHPETIQGMLGLMARKALGMGMFFHSGSKVTIIDPAHCPNFSTLLCHELKNLHSDSERVTFRWAFTEIENGNHYLPDDTIALYGYSDYAILLIDVIAVECDSHMVKKMTEMVKQMSQDTVAIVMTIINRGFTAESLGVDEFYPLLEL
ncbi:MAG: hypothetical protein Q8L10_05015 [Candidatus Moranbacteria bacterium]|nr:hypothetical protein [Candidatus Moranbacteria bacterium]